MTGFNFNRKKFAAGAAPLLMRDFIRKQAVIDFASIATTAKEDVTVAVPGAAVGDSAYVTPAAATGPTAGLILSAWVSAANVVTVRATNITGSGVNADSATYNIEVFKRF